MKMNALHLEGKIYLQMQAIYNNTWKCRKESYLKLQDSALWPKESEWKIHNVS